jgi:hypothetical protein
MRQTPGHRVTRYALATAATTPAIGLDDPTRQHRPVRLESLPHHLQAEFVQSAERSQVRASKGSVRHVEVFQMSGVGTFILGRPRPYSAIDAPTGATPSTAMSPFRPLLKGRFLPFNIDGARP